MEKNKLVGTIFRFVVIIGAVGYVLSFVGLIGLLMADGDLFAEETISSLLRMTTGFNIGFIAGMISFILSIVCFNNFCKKVSAIARSFFIGVVMGTSFVAFKLNSMFYAMASAINKHGEEVLDMTDDELIDLLDISKKQAEEFVEMAETDPEEKMVALLITILLGAIVYGILTLTSIHWLAKDKSQEA